MATNGQSLTNFRGPFIREVVSRGYRVAALPADTFEYYLSRYIIPITIDQRYGRGELEYLNNAIREML